MPADVAQALLAHGARWDAPNKRGYSPLLVASFHGRTRAVEVLLNAPGADVNHKVCGQGSVCEGGGAVGCPRG